jgi:Ca2+-binding EF-hand superfamily protein
MSNLNALGSQGYNPYALQQFAQNLFNQIDTSGSGSISQTELEQAVTGAGGATQAADALYSELNSNGQGGITEQQFAQALIGPSYSDEVQAQLIGYQAQGWPGGSSNGPVANSADGALTALFNADGEDEPGTSPTHVAQNIFSAIDQTGSGAITQAQLEQAVTGAGGTTRGADALFSALDPGNTGSVSEQQFIAALQPPSAGGNTASDALLALVDPASGSTAVATNASTGATAVTPGGSGNGSGTAQAPAQIAAAFTQALALYQAQLNQQLLGGSFGPFASQITLA